MSPEPQSSATPTVDVRDVVATLRLRKWDITAITLVVLLLAFLYVSQKPTDYQSTARVQATNPLAVVDGLVGTAALPNMQNEQIIASSSAVGKCAALIVAHPAESPSKACTTAALAKAATPAAAFTGGLSTSVESTATILDISYTARQPSVAQRNAQAFANAYIQVTVANAQNRLSQERQPLLAQQKVYEDKVAALTSQYAQELKNSKNPSSAAPTQQQLSFYSGQLATVTQQLSQLSPASVQSPILVSSASPAANATSKTRTLVLAGGLIVGLLLGLGFAFLRRFFADDLGGRSQLEELVRAPVLVTVPRARTWRKRSQARLLSAEDPKDLTAEAYRTLRTSILYQSARRGLRSLLVVSPGPGEGKSATAANLAVVLADAGKRVILVSADLRKPRVHEFLGVPDAPGLTDLILGSIEPWDALQTPTVENLRVLSSGHPAPNPAELLQSDAMSRVLSNLHDLADFVIVDSSPLLLVTDGLILAPSVDGVLLVVDAETTKRSAVLEAREALDQVEAEVIGVAMNRYDPRKDWRAAGYHGYRRYARYGAYAAEAPSGSDQARVAAEANGQAPETAPTEPA